MSVEDETEKLANRWIVEYYCWRMWQEFSKNGTVDDGLYRMYGLRGSGNSENFGDRKTHECRLLIHFMRKIAEAAKEMSEETSVENQADVSPAQTTVEDALDLIDYMSNAFTRFEDGELTELQLCLRRYAVLAPLHKDNTATAKAVFNRQWLRRKNAQEMKFRDQLAAMVKGRERVQLNPDLHEVLSKCQGVLEKIMMGMSKPFLLQAAEMVCDKLAADRAESGPSSDDACAADVEKLAANGASKSSAVQCNGSATESHSAGIETMNISSVDDIWRPSTEWRKKRAAKAAGKMPWSSVEEEQVYQGVLAHGVGNWALIHTNCVPTRTNVDIKDKWRIMKRQGRLKTLADKYGPLPASCMY